MILDGLRDWYRAFHWFGQAKFAYGGSILGSAACKHNAQFKSGQNQYRVININPWHIVEAIMEGKKK